MQETTSHRRRSHQRRPLPGSQTPPMDWYVELEPTLGAADWRCELLSLVEPT